MTQETTTTDDTVRVEEMFVQIARGVTSNQSTLTLQDVSPSTLYFSDRPERVVGHMTTGQFVEQWAEGPNSFPEDPPNAVLSYVEVGDDIPLRRGGGAAGSGGVRQLAQILRRGTRRRSAGHVGRGHLVQRPPWPPAEPGVAGRDEPPEPAPGPAPLSPSRPRR